jgi:hypothetical protein
MAFAHATFLLGVCFLQLFSRLTPTYFRYGYGLNCAPLLPHPTPHSYVHVLTLNTSYKNVTLYGNRVFTEESKFK